jgi:hypothetical protein
MQRSGGTRSDGVPVMNGSQTAARSPVPVDVISFNLQAFLAVALPVNPLR